MSFFLLSMMLILATFAVVRPAMDVGSLRAGGRPAISIKLSGVNGTSLVIIVAGLWLIGSLAGIAASAGLVLAYGLHELGRLIGYRLAGHETLSFRLLRLPRAGANSAAPVKTDLEAFFVTLMGPTLGLAPMVMFFAAADWSTGPLSQTLATIAFTLGAFNFAALMPIYPMDGAVLLHLLTRTALRRVSKVPMLILLTALMGFAWSIEAPLLFLLSLVGAVAYAARAPLPDRHRMRPRQAVLAATAALALLCAFFLGGWWVILLVTTGF